MPNFDKTGPRGMGSKTGRGMGNCVSASEQGRGRGRGFGCGAGRGFGRNFTPDSTPQEKLKALEAYKNELETEIKTLGKEAK